MEQREWRGWVVMDAGYAMSYEDMRIHDGSYFGSRKVSHCLLYWFGSQKTLSLVSQ
jgi:hypothetical protein